MTRPKLLITGSSGRIGRLLRDGLIDEFDIYGVDRVSSSDDRTFVADVAEYEQIVAVFEEVAPVPYLVHLAGDPHVDASWESVLRNNIVGTKNVYEAARQHGVQRVVFASSNHVTGAYEGLPEHHLHEQYEPEPVTVEDPIRPDSDYGVSKAFGEALARSYCARWGLSSICLRIGSVLADDDPTRNLRLRKTWLSHRDLVQLVRKSLLSDVVFGIYYGVSRNTGRFWDISNARRDLGYEPIDDGMKH